MAAIIIEPVQGAGGFYVAPVILLRRLRTLCDEHGTLLIVDEVQKGFGRKGKMIELEHYEVESDLLTMSKSLAGGFRLSALTGRTALMDEAAPGGPGGPGGTMPVSRWQSPRRWRFSTS